MEFKTSANLSTLLNIFLCCAHTANLYAQLPTTYVGFDFGSFTAAVIGAMFASNLPIFAYLLRKRGKEKNGLTFAILQNFIIILSLLGQQ